MKIYFGIGLHPFLRISNVLYVIYQHKRVELLERQELISDRMINRKILSYELVNKVKVEIEVMNGNKRVLFQFFEVFPIKELYISNNWIQELFNKWASQLFHVIDCLFHILHQPLYVLNVGLSFELVILRKVRRQHQLNFMFNKFTHSSP